MLLSALARSLGSRQSQADEDDTGPLLGTASSSSWGISGFTTRRYGHLVDSILNRSVPMVGDYAYASVLDGTVAAKIAAGAWYEAWPDIEAQLTAKLRLKLGVAEPPEVEWYRTLRLRGWATRFPRVWPRRSLCPQPLQYLRARFRYACYPADEAAKYGTLLLLLNITTTFQLCNLITFATFLAIDKSDEYQLVSYILANKGYHFFGYGILALGADAHQFWRCVLKDAGKDHPCAAGAPGRDPSYMTELIFETIRVATVWLAFWLLRHSKGGSEQVLALECHRLAIPPDSPRARGLLAALACAEPQEEGSSAALSATAEAAAAAKAAAYRLRLAKIAESQPTASIPGGQSSSYAAATAVVLPPAPVNVAHATAAATAASAAAATTADHVSFHPSARARVEAHRRRGGSLRHLLWYDLGCWLFCYSFALFQLWLTARATRCKGGLDEFLNVDGDESNVDCSLFQWNVIDGSWIGKLTPWLRDWRFMMTVDFAQTAYSLLMFPFALLNLRPLKRYLTLAKPTGYDKAGELCAELTAVEKEQRFAEMERALAEERAAVLVQARFRGAVARFRQNAAARSRRRQGRRSFMMR
jgi:hypothetical protein